MMSANSVTCTTFFVEDAPGVWATKTIAAATNAIIISSISLWYCPANNRDMTMSEVAGVLEADIGIRVGAITARGVTIPREALGNHMAADLLKDREAFTVYCRPCPRCVFL